MSADHSHEHPPSSGGPRRWLFWGFALVAAFFLLAEHRAHVFQYLPFILLLACPLMHMFGHGGHGGHGGHESGPKEQQTHDDAKRTEEPEKKPEPGSTHHH